MRDLLMETDILAHCRMTVMMCTAEDERHVGCETNPRN